MMMETTARIPVTMAAMMERPRRRRDGGVRRRSVLLLVVLGALVGAVLFFETAEAVVSVAAPTPGDGDVIDRGVDVSNDARRSLWLKEFLEKYFQSQRKPTSSPTSVPTAAVPVPAPSVSSSERPTTFMPIVPFFAPGSSSSSKPTASTSKPTPNATSGEEGQPSKAPTPTTTKPTSRRPRTKLPTSKPSSKGPTFEPSSANGRPSELPTIVTEMPTTYSPTEIMTEVPSISVSDNPTTTSPSTSMMPTVAPKLVYFPAKFGTLVYCMHGDLSDPHVLSTMPPANDEMYATMCDCCSAKVGLYECHSNYKAECDPTNKPTSSIITSRPTTHRPTKKGETTVPSVSPPSSSSSPPTLPQMWLYYPVKLDNDTSWCVFGDHNDASFLTLMPPSSNVTYARLCDCCAEDHHKCHHAVEAECAPIVVTGIPTSGPIIVVDPTAPPSPQETEIPTHGPTEEVVPSYSPTNVETTDGPTTRNPTTAKPTTRKPTSKPSTKRPTTSTPSTKRPTTSMPLVPFSSPITKPTSSKPSTLKPTSTIKPTVTSVIPFIHHCDVVVGDVGDSYWYPHDDDEERGCAMDDEYPVGFYDNDALCHSFLFTSVDDCCLKFPDSCNVSVSTDVIEAMWYPEVFTSSSSNIKLLECIPGSDYPSYMTLPKNADTHLFDTKDDCCIHIPCGKKLSNYWYPVADVTAETVVCKFDNDYPIYMLVDSTEKKRLFTNETECVASWGAALHHCDADDGQGQAYWYPHDEDEQGCALDADYPAELYTDNALCTSFLFKTLDECCLKFPDSCLVPTTVNITKTLKWYPEMFISKSKIKMFHCISGNDYPTYMSLPENDDMHLFDSEEECCSVIPCGERLPKYWFPLADADAKTVVCIYDIDYPLYMMKSTDDTYLFSNEADCTAAWEHGGLLSASPSLDPSTIPTTASPTESPSLSPTMEETESPSLSPSMEPSESPSLSPSLEPTGEMDMYYYPRTTKTGKTYCVIGPKSDVTALVGMTKKDVNDYLSSTECECCTKHDCYVKPQGCTVRPTKSPVTAPITPPSMSPTNNPTSVTTTAITTAATPEHQFYPMQFGDLRVCTATKPYPTNADLFPNICACCKKHECSWDMTGHCDEISAPVAAPTTPPAETTTASPTSMTTTAITALATPEHQYYPIQNGNLKFCITAKPYPTNVDLFSDICACCTKHQCSYDPGHCDETSAPVAVPAPPAVTTTAAPTGHQFYPVGGGNVITCISAHPYPDNVDLYSDICQCCKMHGCTINLGDHCDETTSEPTSSPPTSSNPTKLPSWHPTKTPSRHPTKLPSRHPTKTPSKVPTYKPTVNTNAPSNHPITPVPTNKPTVNTSKGWYFPETYSGKKYCMHGTIANVPSIASMNPIDLYETLCDCCAKYECDTAHNEQCNKTKPTTSTPTAVTSQPPTKLPITSHPTSNDVTLNVPSPPPSAQWYFHPVHMGEHDWCAYDILTNNSYMQSLKPEELYTSMCDCCANHICPEYVKTECAAN